MRESQYNPLLSLYPGTLGGRILDLGEGRKGESLKQDLESAVKKSKGGEPAAESKGIKQRGEVGISLSFWIWTGVSAVAPPENESGKKTECLFLDWEGLGLWG